MPRNDFFEDLNLTNVNQEIFKEEIKAKLNRYGCSADDELQNYIIILLANKKATKQIIDDLKPFLNEDSEDFVTWLMETYKQFANTKAIRDNSTDNGNFVLSIQVDSNEFNDDFEYKSRNTNNRKEEEFELRQKLLKKANKSGDVSTKEKRRSLSSRLGPLKQESDDDRHRRRSIGDDIEKEFSGRPSIKSRLGNKRIRTENDEYSNKEQNSMEESMPTKFIVTLKGIDESKFSKNNDNEPRVTFKRRLSDDEGVVEEIFEYEAMSVDGEENNEDGLNTKKIAKRCTFWPSCEKGIECLYIHPNKPCEAFPNCKFGKSCHYLHPACKYDGMCTRADCIYTHMVKRTPILGDIQQPVTPTGKRIYSKNLINQKFSLNNINENENKIKDCKFGKLCKNPTCGYAHPLIPDKSALKWIAPKHNISQQEQTTVEEIGQ